MTSPAADYRSLQDLKVELEQAIDRYVALRSVQTEGSKNPERDVLALIEPRLLRVSAEVAGGGTEPDEISHKTPLGDLLLALTVGKLVSDVDHAPDAWGQFADEALSGFANELDVICEHEQAEFASDSWRLVYRMMVRMRAAAQVFRRVHEARHGMSPHWGGSAPKSTEVTP